MVAQGDLFTRQREKRDAVLSEFERTRMRTVNALRSEAARVWDRTKRPVSVNDVRDVLKREGYTGDPRILGAAFPRTIWKPVADTNTNSELAHARRVRCFVPVSAHDWHGQP